MPFSSRLRCSRAAVVQPGRACRVDGHQDLAGSGGRCQPGGRVHDVAEDGDLDVVPLADGAEPDATGVDARADRNPWPIRGIVPGSAEQCRGRIDGAPRMIGAEEWRKRRNELVADELVDDAAVLVHDVRGDRVVAVERSCESPMAISRSPSAVEPRMSAKSVVPSTSAPPRRLSSCLLALTCTCSGSRPIASCRSSASRRPRLLRTEPHTAGSAGRREGD